MVYGYGNSDEPYALRSEAEREVRRRLLRAPHIAALTEFVDRLRIQTGRGLAIPYIDPLDGEVAAPCLLLLEAVFNFMLVSTPAFLCAHADGCAHSCGKGWGRSRGATGGEPSPPL